MRLQPETPATGSFFSPTHAGRELQFAQIRGCQTAAWRAVIKTQSWERSPGDLSDGRPGPVPHVTVRTHNLRSRSAAPPPSPPLQGRAPRAGRGHPRARAAAQGSARSIPLAAQGGALRNPCTRRRKGREATRCAAACLGAASRATVDPAGAADGGGGPKGEEEGGSGAELVGSGGAGG
ncbi:alanine and glycine-rich protein-like [Lagopus muta]|uniref:alanine and glycine-rich protein-like n=1 Tax=Lagopus muta TaxID=64668 RepID=UPI00209D7DCE|nr:alanine and glycine-rich protein-like [Lagopus muta]